MKEIFEEKIELNKTSVKKTTDKRNTAFFYETSEQTYSLKEQLDNLMGPTDFRTKLESVNLTIGAIVTIVLAYFFLA